MKCLRPETACLVESVSPKMNLFLPLVQNLRKILLKNAPQVVCLGLKNKSRIQFKFCYYKIING